MPFGLYESHGGEQFIRIEHTPSYDTVDDLSIKRNAEACSSDHGPIDCRIVAARDADELPLYATADALSEIVKRNNDLYPR